MKRKMNTNHNWWGRILYQFCAISWAQRFKSGVIPREGFIRKHRFSPPEWSSANR